MTKKQTTKKKTPGVPSLDGRGGGTGSADKGCDTPTQTRKGQRRRLK